MTELYEKSLRKLELDNVLAQLADCANSEDGKDRCRALLPLDDAEEIRLLQQQTTAISSSERMEFVIFSSR